MSELTYKNLYQLVKREIERTVSFNNKTSYSSQYSKTPIITARANTVETDAARLVTDIISIIGDALPSRIISGLTVTATDPESTSVTVASGKGTVAGYVYELSSSTNVNVPLDDKTSVYYLNLYKNAIKIEKNQHPNKLSIAKIVVPIPNTSAKIYNKRGDRDYDTDGYIVNFQEVNLYKDPYDNLEEDSFDFIKDNIGDILASTIVGTMTLSENLAITNTQGTLTLDSKSVNIKDENGNVLAVFDRDGTFFYDSSGSEVAKFGASEARVGNIVIQKNSIQSGNFVEGSRGFRIKDDGKAEFENVKIRGVLNTTVFEKDTMSSIGGNFLVCDSDVLDSDMTSLDSSDLVTSGETTFATGDVLRIKDGIDDEWFEVTAVNGNTYTVTRDKKGSYSSDNNPEWKAGTAVINYGQSGEGLILLTASDDNAPYMSIFTHTGTPWDAGMGQIERLRIGNLNGFLDYNSDKYGIAIGESNKYLKYDPDGGLVLRGDLTMDSGYIGGPSGWQITTNEIVGSVNASLRAGQTDYATGTGFFLGYSVDDYKFSLGDADNYLRWDGNTLNIKGALTMGEGSSIGSNTITADAFVDTVAGNLSLGAVFARRRLTNNTVYTEDQTKTLLDEGTFEQSSGANQLHTADGVLQAPTISRWDESGSVWDASDTYWDYPAELGTYTWISPTKDLDTSYYSLPIIRCNKSVTTPDTITVQVSYSNLDTDWSDWVNCYPSEEDGVTRYYSEEIFKARYLRWKIIFEVTDGTSGAILLEDMYLETLAVYTDIVLPDQLISIEGWSKGDLDDFFSKKYIVSATVHGTTKLFPLITEKSDPPGSVTLKLLDNSGTAHSGTADIHLMGY